MLKVRVVLNTLTVIKARFTIVLALGLMFGCTSSQPALYVREQGEVMLSGEAADILTSDSVLVEFELTGLDNNRWVFSFDVQNNSKASIRVDPSSTFYRYKPRGINSGGNLVRALDPTIELIRIGAQEKELDRAYQNHLASSGLISILDLIFGFAAIGQPKTKAEHDGEYLEELEDEEYEKITRETYDIKKGRLNWERDLWKNEAVHKIVLLPGQHSQGLLYFPVRRINGEVEFQLSLTPYRYIKGFSQVTMNVPL